MSDKIVVYISANGKVTETKMFDTANVNHQKELLLVLHRIGVGLPKGARVTFSTEL